MAGPPPAALRDGAQARRPRISKHKTAIAAALGYGDRAVGGEEPAGGFARPGGDGDPRHRVGAADRLGEDRGLELASEHFMRDYYLHARGVFHLVELGFERVVDKPRRRSRRLLLEEGVVAVDGEISLPDGEAYFREEPLRLLRIFALAQSRSMRLGEQAQRCILQSLDLIDDGFRRSPDARAIFSAVIRRKQRVAAAMRSMHELGVLGAYLPEFGSLTCLVQYDIFHLYTVDEHTLVALENLEALSKREEGSSLKRVHDAPRAPRPAGARHPPARRRQVAAAGAHLLRRRDDHGAPRAPAAARGRPPLRASSSSRTTRRWSSSRSAATSTTTA